MPERLREYPGSAVQREISRLSQYKRLAVETGKDTTAVSREADKRLHEEMDSLRNQREGAIFSKKL